MEESVELCVFECTITSGIDPPPAHYHSKSSPQSKMTGNLWVCRRGSGIDPLPAHYHSPFLMTGNSLGVEGNY